MIRELLLHHSRFQSAQNVCFTPLRIDRFAVMRMEPLLFADENAPEWALQRSGQREKV